MSARAAVAIIALCALAGCERPPAQQPRGSAAPRPEVASNATANSNANTNASNGSNGSNRNNDAPPDDDDVLPPFSLPEKPQHLSKIELKMGGRWVPVEVAKTEKQRQTGLMFRTDLEEGAGMLFVFTASDYRNFWMHETPLPLSIAYIAADGRITQIADLKPYDEDLVPSREQAKYALEVHQGFFRAAGVREGDRVEGLERAGAAK
jgi:uncharacterized membrane protein (UPF0127 family)